MKIFKKVVIFLMIISIAILAAMAYKYSKNALLLKKENANAFYAITAYEVVQNMTK